LLDLPLGRDTPIMKPAHVLGSTLLCSVAAWALSATARADDLKLKDGTKISGTIVGFEDNSFRVKTSYGFAVVEKGQVASISMADAVKASADKPPATGDGKTEKSKAESASSSPAPAPPTAPVNKPVPAPNAAPSAAKNAEVDSGSSTPAPPTAPAAAPVVAKNSAPPTASPSPSAAEEVRPPKPPAPEPIREQVSGNTYTNETYRFRMFKPPGWDVIASAPAVLPGAITAMGTADDTTYLLIGQEPAGKSLTADMDATEHRLRDVMEHFRALGEDHITVSGEAAMEHHFRGSVDQHDWSGVVVLVARGPKLYTIFGMTRADNDLVQLQENVITRAIASLQFLE